jgi:hypothetical protein
VNGGLIVTQTPSSDVHRALIITLAARHQLPMQALRSYHQFRVALCV